MPFIRLSDLDLSATDALESAERTLRHAIAHLAFLQMYRMLDEGRCTIYEALLHLQPPSLQLPLLLPGDVDPITGVPVPASDQFQEHLDA